MASVRIIKFGKYKGTSESYVERTDPSYYPWFKSIEKKLIKKKISKYKGKTCFK